MRSGEVDRRMQSIQVQLMADIYRCAQRALVWLGPSTEGVGEFHDTLPKANALVAEVQAALDSLDAGDEEGEVDKARQTRVEHERGEIQ